MTIFFNKARDRWMYDFRLGGHRYAGYCVDASGQPVASRSAAKQAEGVERRRAEMGPKVARADELTLAGAMASLVQIWERQDDWKNKKRYMKELVAFFGAETAVADISEARIQDYIAYALNQPVRIWTGGPSKEGGKARLSATRKTGTRLRSRASVNLYLHMMRQVFGRASKVRDAQGNPAIKDIPNVPVLSTPRRRARPVPDYALSKLLTILPEHVMKAIFLTLYFGLRKSEVFSLKTHQADFIAGGIRLEAEDVKDEEDAYLPGAPDAMAFLALLCGETQMRGTTALVTYRRGETWAPIKSPRTAWNTAMAIIEKEFGRKWRWHDLRAAFITHVALTSGPELARTLARHSDYKTTLGYVAVADEMRKEAARRAAVRPALALINSDDFTNTLHKQKLVK